VFHFVILFNTVTYSGCLEIMVIGCKDDKAGVNCRDAVQLLFWLWQYQWRTVLRAVH